MGGAHLSQRKGGQPRPTRHSGQRSDRSYQSQIETVRQQLIARDAELCICRDELSRRKVDLRLCQQDCTDFTRTNAAQNAANMDLVDVVNQLQLDLEWARGVHHR